MATPQTINVIVAVSRVDYTTYLLRATVAWTTLGL